MMNRKKATRYREMIENTASLLDDKTALERVELFPLWNKDIAYNTNDRVSYQKTLYKCVQSHTSQESWTPDITPALWVQVSIEEYPEWRQPTGVQDAYNIGDKVTFNNEHYISIVDANVWQPDIYGWEKQ